MNRVVFAMSLVLILMLIAGVSAGQVALGVAPFNSYGGGPFDSINLGNLNAHFCVPIVQKAGRGLPFTYNLCYDSSIWQVVGSGGTQSWQPITKAGNFNSYWGWQGLGPVFSPYVSYTISYLSGMCADGQGHLYQWQQWNYAGYAFYDQYGEAHGFGSVGGYYVSSPGYTGCPAPGSHGNTTGTSQGYTINVSFGQNSSTGTVTAPGGTSLYTPFLTSAPPPGSSPYTATDSNGNEITFNNGSYVDTLGQTVLTVQGTEPSNTTFTYPGPSGNVPYTVSYKQYTVSTNFHCSGVTDYPATNIYLVDRITLPDATYYQLNYETTAGSSGRVTGRLQQVTLPTGGTIQYSYPTTNGGAYNAINCTDGTPPTAGGTDQGYSLTRALTPGGTWTYARGQVSGQWQTTITTPSDPQNGGNPPPGDDTVITFSEDNTYSFYETNRQSYQGPQSSGNLLLTTSTCWNSTCSAVAPITEQAVTLQYPNGGLQSKTVTFYGVSTGLPTEIDQYAYASGTPTTIAQKTIINYGSWTGSACNTQGNTVLDVKCQVIVQDGGGHTLAQTNYSYDEYSTYPLQVTSGTPQHVSVTNSYRRNPTTISTYKSGSTTLTKHFSYYDTGNVYKAYDVNGAITTYGYGACGNSFPTSVTLPITVGGTALSTSSVWNCIGGVTLSATDVNGNTTTTTYNDADYWRPASIAAPYTSNTNTTTSFTYTPYSSTSGDLANMDTSMLVNGGASIAEQLSTVNQFGQTLYSQRHEGPGSSYSWDATQANYDAFLRPYQGTMPCVTASTKYTASSSGPCLSSGTTTSTFDALGRVTQTTDGGGGWVQSTYTQNDVLQAVGPAPSGENNKQKQLEYDALGRLTKVCELTSLNGYGVCSLQSSSPNGYLTTYAYSVNSSGNPTVTVKQNAQASSGQQTRTYAYDLLGRLISETNPETNNLTASYTYDSDSSGTCSGTYNGDLVKLVDAKGNTICYQYDAIHRNTQIIYPSGPDSGNTPSKTFVYDAATFNGNPLTNAKGHLAEAYTGSSSSKTTDEFFQYSVRNELTDTWECTPHSGTNGCSSVSNYYHVTAGFWENGVLKTLSSNISGLPTENYGVDTMGRTNAVSASAGQNPVTSATYNLATFTNAVTYGSGDSDTFYIDSNTGRQTKYVFRVNGATNTGQTTWNKNGSLGSFQITDNISSTSDTQNCSYTHDDLVRIASVNCLNGSTKEWNQQFTYDAFGNVTKNSSGPGGVFQPTYSSSSNWITALPGCSPTTDNNGQMTYDCVHNYTWDAEGKMHSVDANPATCSTSGTCLTHDALGRMVETASGSTYTQIVYGPSGGEFTAMNGQTLVKAFISLPSSVAIYTSASLNTTQKIAYYRHTDHLGSSRLATTPTQTLYSSTAFSPYGEPYGQAGTTDLSFTGIDQDTVSGIHDFLARKYPPAQGRWLSPDPAGLGAVDPTTPQSWNRYAYVINSPMEMVDPLGLANCTGVPNGMVNLGTAEPGCSCPENGGQGCGYYICTGGTANTCMPVSAASYNAQIQSGAAGQCPNNDCVGLQLTTTGWYQWIPAYELTTGEADPSCSGEPGVVCQSTLVYQLVQSHWDAFNFGSVATGSQSVLAANNDVPVGMDIWHNSPQCPHCADLWKQADCTFNGTLKDEAGGLADTAATAAATGAITARSVGTQVTKAVLKELGTAFTELTGILEYGKVMLKTGYKMVAGCE